MQIIKKIAVWCAVFNFCLVFGSAEAKVFDMTEFRLKNGLQVIVIPNHKAPIVRQMVWYKVGSVDEKIGKGGTAHLLEHLIIAFLLVQIYLVKKICVIRQMSLFLLIIFY